MTNKKPHTHEEIKRALKIGELAGRPVILETPDLRMILDQNEVMAEMLTRMVKLSSLLINYVPNPRKNRDVIYGYSNQIIEARDFLLLNEMAEKVDFL